MNIILVLLKIIGLILLILLGIVILLLFLVLFVPLRYRVSASYDKKEFPNDIRFSWLLSIFYFRGKWSEKAFHYKVRLFGIPIFNSDRKKKEQKPVKEKKRPEKEEQKSARKEQKPVTEEQKPAKEESKTKKEDKTEKKAKEIKSEERHTEKPHLEKEIKSDSAFHEDEGDFSQKKETKAAFSDKIKELIQKLTDPKVKEAFELAKNHLIRLLRHVLPGKWKLSVSYGTDDPALTGSIYGYYCMFIPLWGNHVMVYPDFENSFLTVNGYAKGRIRAIVLLYIGLQFMFKKELVYLRKQFF